uniref:alpha-glucosidase n=1 Tax=Lygus hesperus TaxID=30085 RepID=A0A0A9Z9X9_LYGHE
MTRALRLLLCVCAVVNAIAGEDVEWWQNGPIYQVYPATFADSNGDGWGDIKGILEHADYFKDIGVGAVWLSPIFASPMQDNGYDVANYTDVNPIFGTKQDVKDLIDKLHSLGIKFMLDFVPNHSSDQHVWFKNSVNRVPGYENFYVWRNKSSSKMDNGKAIPLEPNNWRSLFTPSAWTWNDQRGQFYLHQFGAFQPDLNYDEPLVVEAMKNVMRFWLDMGVDGLRVDATPYLIETHYDLNQPDFPGCVPKGPLDYYECQQHLYTRDQPKLYDIMAEFAKVLDEYKNNGTRYQFIEAYAALNFTMMYYMNSTSPFNFNILSYLNQNSNASVAKYAVDLWMNNMPKGRWANWVTGNHDNARVATRFGEDMVDAINTMSILLPGTPITYMGEEIGMSNSLIPEDLRRDKTDFNRDPERAPMQWNASLNAGFSSNPRPYLPVASNYWRVNVEAEKSTEKSHLGVYKKLVSLHKDLVAKGAEDFQTYVITPWVFAFTRPNHLILINFNNLEEEFTLSGFKLPNGKEIPSKLFAKIPSINSEYSEMFEIDTKNNITMRPRSSVVLSVSGGSVVFKSSAILIFATFAVTFFKF